MVRNNFLLYSLNMPVYYLMISYKISCCIVYCKIGSVNK